MFFSGLKRQYLSLVQLFNGIISHKKSFGNSREQIIQYLENLGYKLIGEKKHYTTHIFSDVICVDMLFNK